MSGCSRPFWPGARCGATRAPPLTAKVLAQVREIAEGAQALVPANRYQPLLGQSPAGRDPVQTLGAYCRIVNPPHYLLPYALGGRRPALALCRDGRLYLFVKRRNRRYLAGATASYNQHDGGTGMGNVTLALEALGVEGR